MVRLVEYDYLCDFDFVFGLLHFFGPKVVVKILLLFLIPFFSTPSLADYEVIDDYYCEMTKFVTVYANKPTANWKLERFKMELEMDNDLNRRVVLRGGYVDYFGANFTSGISDEFIAINEPIWSIEFKNGILRIIDYGTIDETHVILAECI